MWDGLGDIGDIEKNVCIASESKTNLITSAEGVPHHNRNQPYYLSAFLSQHPLCPDPNEHKKGGRSLL